ncbi:MAG: hypothetical protein AB7E47_04820 [Desulfovibrionaceae bacterium]
MANPTADARANADLALEQELSGLKREYDALKERKVRTEQDLANLERQLADLETEAHTAYGTADPEELEALLAAKREENARLVAAYGEHIATVRAGLAAVEAATDGAQGA